MLCLGQASQQNDALTINSVDHLGLAMRLKERDATAMIELYDRYGVLLYSVLLRIVPNKSVAEDLLQDAFFRIWNKVGTFDEQRGSFESWIVTIARHCAIDHIRSRRNSVIDSKSNFDDIEVASHLSRPETSNESVLRKIVVERALKVLTKRQREILEMVYFKGLTHTEIACLLNKPLGTVKGYVRTALQIVRDTSADVKP